MKFNYKVYNSKNKNEKGIIEAGNLREATQLLIDKGWYIKKISPRGKVRTGFAEFSIGRVTLIDKVLFVKHLSTMIKSGIDISEALEVIADQSSSPKFKKVVRSIVDKVKKGQNLANALAKHPKVFDPLIINIISVGEESGTLEENLDYLARELEDRLELRRKIKAASFYPAIILTATFGLGLVLSYFVLPKITRLFDTLSFELPLSTKILLWMADVMDNYGLFVIGGVIFVAIAFKFIISVKFVKPVWHRLLIKMPIIGNIIINYNLALMNRTLGTLLKTGLTIDNALTITSDTLSNHVYKSKLNKALPQVQKGKRLSDVLAAFKQSKRKPLFPLLVTKMIGVGERSGRLDESLTYLADYFEKEVDNTTKNLTTTIEPILLLIVGLLVGFVAVSVISPIYQVTGQFNR